MYNRYFNATEDNQGFLFANIAVKNIHFAQISLYYILDRTEIEWNVFVDEHTYYFFHLQSVLTACGNIVGVFRNCTNKIATARSRMLREQFEVTSKEFPLVFQKEVRNTNMHFDERYDHFRGLVGDYNILTHDTHQDMRETIENTPHLRIYDKEQQIYYTYNQRFERISYDLNQLRWELARLLTRITENPIFNSAWVYPMPGEDVR